MSKRDIPVQPRPHIGRQPLDVIIVGGGSAGAVLAARLSADGQRRVLLLEAGPNFAPDSYPSVLTDPSVVGGSPAFDWHYHSEDAVRLGHDIPLPRGRVIGGSSAVNGTVAIRARPADFAHWAKRGIKGWPWEEVLAAYKALESTPTGDDAWHGRSGPFPIRQRTAEENTPSTRAFVEASETLGLAHVSDFNGATQHGVGPYPLNVVDGVRMNTGMVYLTYAVRARPNLTIRGGAEVDCVVIQDKRAVGVKLLDGEVLPAGEIILAGGTFGSPAILMRSGIGPSQHLQELGIPAIADLPVGDRLKDHPFFYNVYALKRDANAMKPPAGAIVLACAVTQPKSIGRLRLSSRDPRAMPHIRYNFFDDPNDLDRLVEAVRLSRKIGRTAPFSDLVDHEMTPGNAVDDGEVLRANIVATVGPSDIDRADGNRFRSDGCRRRLGQDARRRSVARRGRVDPARRSVDHDYRDDDHGGRAHRGKIVHVKRARVAARHSISTRRSKSCRRHSTIQPLRHQCSLPPLAAGS